MTEHGLRGRPAHETTPERRKMVEALAGYGIPAQKIAYVLGCSVGTVCLRYKDELAQGAAKVEAQLVGNLLRMSNGKDATALRATIFSLQTRFGWSNFQPQVPDELPLGKKAEANRAAATAHEDTDWAGLVN